MSEIVEGRNFTGGPSLVCPLSIAVEMTNGFSWVGGFRYLDLAHTVCIAHATYMAVITRFGHLELIEELFTIPSIPLAILFSGLVDFVVRVSSIVHFHRYHLITQTFCNLNFRWFILGEFRCSLGRVTSQHFVMACLPFNVLQWVGSPLLHSRPKLSRNSHGSGCGCTQLPSLEQWF